jgi:hypothetical protein
MRIYAPVFLVQFTSSVLSHCTNPTFAPNVAMLRTYSLSIRIGQYRTFTYDHICKCIWVITLRNEVHKIPCTYAMLVSWNKCMHCEPTKWLMRVITIYASLILVLITSSVWSHCTNTILRIFPLSIWIGQYPNSANNHLCECIPVNSVSNEVPCWSLLDICSIPIFLSIFHRRNDYLRVYIICSWIMDSKFNPLMQSLWELYSTAYLCKHYTDSICYKNSALVSRIFMDLCATHITFLSFDRTICCCCHHPVAPHPVLSYIVDSCLLLLPFSNNWQFR